MSLLGFLSFYSMYILYFEQRVSCLRQLASLDMEADVTQLLTKEHEDARRDMILAITSDPCIARHDYKKRSYLLTDFSKLGFGFNLCQPNDDPESLAAMRREMEGGECEFLKPGSKLLLKSTGFGSRKARGRESTLHSHLGEGFCLDWAINRNRSKLYGTRFSAITDCYALRFILTYDGPNPVILRMQMRFMLWAMDLYHRVARFLATPDYFSRLGADLYFDEMSREYLSKTIELRKLYPPVSGMMRPENMPGYRAPRIKTHLPQQDNAAATLLSSIMLDDSGGHQFCLQTVPLLTGYLNAEEQNAMTHVAYYNHEVPVYAAELTSFSFAVYGFNSGHFINRYAMPSFQVAMAADTRPCGRALFKKFTGCPVIADSADGLLQTIAASTAKSLLHGYCIHSHRFLKNETEKKFWAVQAAIVRALREKRGIIALCVYIRPACDMALAAGFRCAVQRTG